MSENSCCDFGYEHSHVVIVGHHAPDFTAPAVLGNGEIVGDFDFFNILFSYEFLDILPVYLIEHLALFPGKFEGFPWHIELCLLVVLKTLFLEEPDDVVALHFLPDFLF